MNLRWILINKIITKLLFSVSLLGLVNAIKSNIHSSSMQDSKIPPNTEPKYQSFLDKNLDFYITKHDFINPLSTQSKYKAIKSFLKDNQTNHENKADIFIFPPDIIFVEEEKYRKEILNNIIKKEVNIEDYKLNENSDVYLFPEFRMYENHPIKLLKNSNTKIKNFSEFSSKITFEPKTIDIIDK